MNKVDNRFGTKDYDLINKIVGKKIGKIVQDEFIYTNTTFGHANIFVDKDIYEIKCSINHIDYYGNKEDVAILNFNKVAIDDVKSELEGLKQVEIKINDILVKVDIINEHQHVKFDNDEYSYDYTKGIILYFNDIEYAFKMSAWFSEVLEIYKGHNLLDKFNNNDDFNESFSDANEKQVIREIKTI